MKDRISHVPKDFHKTPVILRKPDEADILYQESLTSFMSDVAAHIQTCEHNTQIALDDNEKLWLTRFAETAFIIGYFIEDDSQLAAWATLYSVNEAFAAKNLAKSITSPVNEPIKASVGPLKHPMIDNIDYAREILRDSSGDLSEITRLDTHLPYSVPLYIVARYLTHKQNYPLIDGELSESVFMREFNKVAEAMLTSENPDIFFNFESIKSRGIGSRLAVLTMDYWLRERAFPAFVFGNWALNEITDTPDYPSRWQNSSRLSLSDFTSAIPSKSVVDFTVVPKGILGAIQRSLKNPSIALAVREASGSKETDIRYKIQMLAELVDRFLLGEADSDEQVLLQVFEEIGNLHDIYRARVIIPDEDLNSTVSGLATEGKVVNLYLERNINGTPEKRVLTINPDSAGNEDDIDPEAAVSEWQKESQEQGAISTYACVKIITEIKGVKSELQIMRLSDVYGNWASRKAYKSIRRNQIDKW